MTSFQCLLLDRPHSAQLELKQELHLDEPVSAINAMVMSLTSIQSVGQHVKCYGVFFTNKDAAYVPANQVPSGKGLL